MQIDIRKPQFSGSDKEKIQQMHSYIFQLVDQLQWAFESIDRDGGGSQTGGQTGSAQVIQQSNTQTVIRPPTSEEAEATFDALKALIIKSSEIVDAYYEKMSERLSSVYVAQSDFGEYQREVNSEIEKNAENISVSQEKIETLSGVFQDREEAAYVVKNSGYVKTGFLAESEYGIEIGQISEENGAETFRGSARFTPGAITFYDENELKAAWLGKRRLHAREVEAVEKQQIGGFIDEVDPETGDVTTKWVGKES